MLMTEKWKNKRVCCMGAVSYTHLDGSDAYGAGTDILYDWEAESFR